MRKNNLACLWIIQGCADDDVKLKKKFQLNSYLIYFHNHIEALFRRTLPPKKKFQNVSNSC